MIKKQLVIGPIKALKSGTNKKGGTWTLYLVECSDQENEVQKFTTFNDFSHQVGKMVPIYLEKEVNGQFINWKEATKSSEAKANEDKFKENVYEAFRVMNEKLDKLLARP